jgi:single-strand DNA-binding protein
MATFNKVLLIGNLTRDPIMKTLPNNTDMVEFGMAINEYYKDKDGEKHERTLFVDCQMFGTRSEFFNNNVQKGSQLFVEGKLRQDTWEDKDGKRRNKLWVNVFDFQLMGQNGAKSTESEGKNEKQRQVVSNKGKSKLDNSDIPF